VSGISTQIARLADAAPATREAAAANIYEAGRSLGVLAMVAAMDAAPPPGLSDPELRALQSGPPTVGIAVEPATFEKIRAANGTPRLADVPPDQDALEFELHFGTIAIDVLTTKAPGGGGAIAKFLEKFGEDIQQVEYPVTDVDRATELFRTRLGLQPIYPQTRPGADGTRVNFFLLQTPEGKKVLIEFVEQK